MSKWLARAQRQDRCLPPVPIVPKSPKLTLGVQRARHFGDYDNFGTGDRHPNGRIEAPLPAARIDQDEREAIAIELGGVPVIYAKAFAQIQARPPADVPDDRWHRFVDDGGRFLDRWGGEAERLGWTAVDLFGLDQVKPMARYNNMGLMWCSRASASWR
jgi:hypothetical protein